MDLSFWQYFSYGYYGSSIALNVVFSIVVTIGGAYDLVYLFKALSQDSNELDQKNTE